MNNNLRVYYCKNFKGKESGAVAAVVVAENRKAARDLLARELSSARMTQLVYLTQLVGVDIDLPQAIIINDGSDNDDSRT